MVTIFDGHVEFCFHTDGQIGSFATENVLYFILHMTTFNSLHLVSSLLWCIEQVLTSFIWSLHSRQECNQKDTKFVTLIILANKVTKQLGAAVLHKLVQIHRLATLSSQFIDQSTLIMNRMISRRELRCITSVSGHPDRTSLYHIKHYQIRIMTTKNMSFSFLQFLQYSRYKLLD